MSNRWDPCSFRPTRELSVNYQADLNPQQLAAVTAGPGPALVLAGAGAGKTRTLIYRLAFLLEQGIPPRSILLLTFTNKAAQEMMRRASNLLGADLAGVWGGTFHAIGARLLRWFSASIGYAPDFTILDREDSEHCLKGCIEQVKGWSTKGPKPNLAAEIFSFAANTRRSISDVINELHPALLPDLPAFEELARQYQARKLADNVMDFDDLLIYWQKLLSEPGPLRDYCLRNFRFVLVDEYQDTNTLQAEIVDMLAQEHGNIMAVGDDSQSIYSWRGANYQNLLEFPKRHPDAKIYKIEINYRSTPEILAVANAVIAANPRQFPKVLTPTVRSGDKPFKVVCLDTQQQAKFVAHRIQQLHEFGTALGQIAVLYRSHFHALDLQMHLNSLRIPYSITSGIRFFEQAHIKDVCAYLRLLWNPFDELSFKRLAQMLPGVGEKSANRLWLAYKAQLPKLPARAAPSQPPSPDAPTQVTKNPADPAYFSAAAQALHACASLAPQKAATAWQQWVEIMRQLADPQLCDHPGDMIRLVVEGGYCDYIEANLTRPHSRMEDLEHMAVYAGEFDRLEDFLTDLALLSNLDAEDNRRNDEDRVRLSTVHQAKGLEFEAVFVIMLCDGMFPSGLALRSTDGEEEERRIFYVAITRAKRELYLCYPVIIGDVNRAQPNLPHPSRFLSEIPEDCLELVDLTNLPPATC